MDLLLALLLQGTVAPEAAPRLSYANDSAAQAAPRPRVNQGRSFQIDWSATAPSQATQPRQERRPAAPARAAPGRTTLWNGVPVRMIDGQPHGLW